VPENRPSRRTINSGTDAAGARTRDFGKRDQHGSAVLGKNRSIVSQTGVIALSMVRHQSYGMQDRFRCCRRIKPHGTARRTI